MSKPKSLEEMLESLATKTDVQYSDLDKRLDNIEKVMIAQEINLKEHMRRSDSLEKIIGVIQERDLKPLSKHVAMVEGAFKLLGVMALVVTIVGGLAKLFSVI